MVATHFHHDHIGGIRGYVAAGATVILGAGAETHLDAILAAPHTVAPDALALNPVPVNVIAMAPNTSYTLSDNVRQVVIYSLPNVHADDNLMAYVPDAKLAFVSDVYNPGLPAPIPPQFDAWAIDFYNKLLPLGLDLELISGGHGLTLPIGVFYNDINLTL